MGQKKLERFAEIRTFSNVLEYPKEMQGKWADFFKNENPVILELACGKGEYAVGLGKMYRTKNFIGIDIKGNRIWVGAKAALADGLSNVAFLRSHIDKVADYFSGGEVSEIWITFPDPQLRHSRMKKRLTHPNFLRLYRQILHPAGIVHLKTDSPDLYRFTKTVIELYDLNLLKDDDNVFSKEKIIPELQIKTHYEKLDIAGSKRIHYLSFQINKELPKEKDEILKQIFSEQQV
ncbi:MAG: tRNA (guanosine(46)-N7)-methyltransferase TrmB [Chitinophagaceae bacterium]|jgi:tRNA (guanine-N7-)-methyltransferase|nr:tRNA (guanosine(46)-N7)-methyltransferase TrmB [Chitinophagaceae bacterium]